VITAVRASAHERHREGLAALADDGVLAGAVASTPAGEGLESPVRLHERFRPGAAAYVTLGVRDAARPECVLRVDAFVDRPALPASARSCVAVADAGWLVVRPLGEDPGLPGLATVLRGPARASVVRYRPGRRCTLRVEQGTVRYARVGPDAGAALEMQRLAWAGRLRHELGFAVARPFVAQGTDGVTWQEGVAGEPAAPLLYGRAGARLAERMGTAAASLTASSIEPPTSLDRVACLDSTRRVAAEVRAAVPALGPGLDEVLDRLVTMFAGAPWRLRLRPVHGDLNPPNWLVRPDGLALVDFEDLAVGDPELDVATWTSEVEAETGAALPVTELSARFVAAFERAAGPLDPRLLAAYRTRQRLWKVVKAVRAVAPDGDARALARLDAVLTAAEQEAA
jgi:aminoglycoside phosphotransferase (APT) family kinase protein